MANFTALDDEKKMLVSSMEMESITKQYTPLRVFPQNRCAAGVVVGVFCEIIGQSLLQRFLMVVWFLWHLLLVFGVDGFK